MSDSVKHSVLPWLPVSRFLNLIFIFLFWFYWPSSSSVCGVCIFYAVFIILFFLFLLMACNHYSFGIGYSGSKVLHKLGCKNTRFHVQRIWEKYAKPPSLLLIMLFCNAFFFFCLLFRLWSNKGCVWCLFPMLFKQGKNRRRKCENIFHLLLLFWF